MKALKARRLNSRGQTSVEYLVLLAIAIVISVVAVGVIAGFIRIGSATTYKRKGMVYWKTAEIAIMDWDIRNPAVRNSTLIISNQREYQMDIDWISIDGGVTTQAMDITLLPGDTYKYQTTSLNCSNGESYAYTITFQYTNVEHDVEEKRFTGIEKLTGTCTD